MPTKKKTTTSTPVTTLKHKDKRTNIPTEELRDFIADEEKQPKTVLYPRDPSLDPQLVWKGKDEQDAADLAVPAVPIYIQEKIQPQAIIENVRAEAKHDVPAQIQMFADFNGLTFEDKVDFYHHEQSWTNRMILGDSLMVMASLAEKEGLKGKVQMIYIDPPYGIKFGSNWQVSTRKRDVKDGKVEDATRQPEQVKAFRDTWELGIHSYLAYLRDRLVVARELLTESGSVFVQIGDENVHLVRSLLDEVFGSENFVATISFQKTSYATSETVPSITDYLVWYAKKRESVKIRKLFFSWLSPADNNPSTASEESDANVDDNGDFQSRDLASAGAGASTFDLEFEGKNYHPGVNRHWKTDREGLERVLKAGRLFAAKNSLRYKRLLTDFPWTEYTNVWTDTVVGSFHEDKIYVVQTSPKVVARCMLMTTDPGDLVLDPTCGGGTTAYVAEQWGRRWITIDTSRVAVALARTRLMAAKYPYYLLADEANPQIAQIDAEKIQFPDLRKSASSADIKRGFVYKRVPHVTLKAIANNEEIDAIHAKWQPQLEAVRAQLNKTLKQKWEEWEIPRELPSPFPYPHSGGTAGRKGEGSGMRVEAERLLAEWWQVRRERQSEIDASIAKRADTELLYDQPYEDNKRIRVTGPFTVESLSPHRVLSTDDAERADEKKKSASSAQSADKSADKSADDFAHLIIDNLKKAGVQNTVKQERLKFDRLEPYAGVWVNAVGEYTEAPHPGPLPKGEGVVKRVAVSIGPEHGTVGPEQVQEAAKEAVQGIGFDLLIVCGFAFDPHVSLESMRYGKLQVLIARMNPDLSLGDEVLKKTGAGNLFMVFGEPDIVIRSADDADKRKPLRKSADNRIVVEIKGVDVYDPTTGVIRSHTTDEIACWFIDTAYDGESFFVRQAYFTGAGDPYDRLKRALRAEIDEGAWEALYTTKSYPFDAPPGKKGKPGKIAVKVINHYGDEVLKVVEVG